MPLLLPKGKKRTALLDKLRDIFRNSISQPISGLIDKINPICGVYAVQSTFPVARSSASDRAEQREHNLPSQFPLRSSAKRERLRKADPALAYLRLITGGDPELGDPGPYVE